MIRYGQQANRLLNGRHIEIYMIQNTDGSPTWVCGKIAASRRAEWVFLSCLSKAHGCAGSVFADNLQGL